MQTDWLCSVDISDGSAQTRRIASVSWQIPQMRITRRQGTAAMLEISLAQGVAEWLRSPPYRLRARAPVQRLSSRGTRDTGCVPGRMLGPQGRLCPSTVYRFTKQRSDRDATPFDRLPSGQRIT